MKSIFLTFLMFIVVFSLLKLNILSVLSSNYLLYFAIISLTTVIAAALYFVGYSDKPKAPNNDDDSKDNHSSSSKMLCILLALVVGLTILPAAPSWADEEANAHQCKKEALEDIEKKLQELTEEAVSQLSTDLKAYNTAAEAFIKNCAPGLNLQTPWEFDDVTTKILTGRGVVPATLQYTGINWGDTNAPNTSNCPQLLETAKNAFDVCDKSRQKVQNGVAASRAPNKAQCTCNDDGEDPECVIPDGEQAMANTGKCPPFSQYQSELSGCPLCSIFIIILNTDANLAHLSWEAAAKPLQNIVLIFFLVLLAIESLKTVSAMAGAKTSSFLKSVLTIGLKVAIAYILLSQSSYIYGYFVSPVLKGGLDMGLAVAGSSGANTGCMSVSGGTISTQELDSSLLNSILSAVNCFNSSASITPAIGRGLMCNSIQSWHFNFNMWLNGFAMFLFGMLIWLAISFYLIDCTVQLGILCAMIPLLIACWPFKMTQSYSYKGVKLLMNTFFNYVMIGVVLLIGTMIMSYASTGNGEVDMQSLITALNDNDLKLLNKIASLDAFQLLIVVACGIFAMKLIVSVNSLADQFSKGAGTAIGSKLGGMAAAATTKMAVSGAKIGGNAVLNGAKSVSNRSGLTGAVQKGTAAIQRGHGALWRGVGRLFRLGKYQNKQTGSGIDSSKGQSFDADNKDKFSDAAAKEKQSTEEDNIFRGL